MDNRVHRELLEDVKLRRLELSDAESMLSWMKDPEIYKNMKFNPEEQNIERCKDFIKDSWDSKEHLHYAIVDKNNNYLGTVSLKNINYQDNNAEFAIALCRKNIGLGIGGKALELILHIAFTEKQLHKVYLYVRSDNIRAIKMYERNGFCYEGEFKEHILVNEEYRDILWYAMNEEKYRKFFNI